MKTNPRIPVYALVIGALLLLTACSGATSDSQSQGGNSQGSNQQPVTIKWGQRSKASDCQAQLPLQDRGCTPGDIFPDVTAAQVCVSGYSSSVRDVPDAEKNAVYAEYGITSHRTGDYEVDHLVSLELGGSNDISNLWPEPASPKPGFHEKDAVENYLHKQVCSGAMTLQQAQQQIATDWMVVYNQIHN